MISELTYKGKIVNKYCAICKLTFRDDDTIVSCPTCQSLFHEDHFVEWLTINSECPVCERDFSDIITKYSIRQIEKPKPAQTHIRHYQQLQDYKFYNPSTAQHPILGLVVGFIFGTFLGLLPLVASSLFPPIPVAIFAVLFSYIFFLVGIAVFRLSILGYKRARDNPWTDVVFTEKSVIINNSDLSTKKLAVDDISSIIFDRRETKHEGESREYKIMLEIETAKNDIISFGEVYKSNDVGEREQIYQYVDSLIRTRYNIIPRQTPRGLGVWLRRSNKNFCLYTTISFVLISIVLLIINHFWIHL